MKFKFIPVIFTAALTSVATLFVAGRFQERIPYFTAHERVPQQPVNYAAYTASGLPVPSVDFQPAAEASIKAVVHVKTKTRARTVVADDPYGNDVFSQLFGQRQTYIQQGSGSGVVISPDGYIVTNNHVVANADQVTVTFNDRFTTDATVVATDASTDLAILKVNEKNLAYMEFGNSDNVKLGQWVLAVGYPLSLDATVTAGIVSAKSRSIGINRTQSAGAIESFIQTDAAVNPGNSGGALVNTEGQLIGINSAIASPTGSYAGYSYAIPANIVRKITNDLVQFGNVQRAYLGIVPLDRRTATPEEIVALKLDREEAVYIRGIKPGTGAEKAGLQKGDFITHINGVPVRTYPELQEQVTKYNPGDNVSVQYLRNGASKTTTIQLANFDGSTGIIKKQDPVKLLGAKLRTISNDEKKKYNIAGGVVVANVGSGALAATNMKDGFIITSLNEIQVTNVEEMQRVLAAVNKGNISVGGLRPGYQGMYYYAIKAGALTEE